MLAHLGIRANAVCPGEINTAILSPGTDDIVERIPLRRLGSPDEVAVRMVDLRAGHAGMRAAEVKRRAKMKGTGAVLVESA